jgi:hypothetical protein
MNKNKDKTQKKFTRAPIFIFTKINYIIFFIGVATIIIGYQFLSIGPANSVYSLTIAPILLVMGYLVIIPLAIFWRLGKKESQ